MKIKHNVNDFQLDTYEHIKQSSEPAFISVLLPVYNGAEHLKEAIQSILEQTYPTFELIIINDGSTDDSAAIIKQFTDPRIRYYEQENHGLAFTLNRAIELSKGKYLARQDQDDISLPQRFEKQVRFMEAHADCGMVGTWAMIWKGNNETKRNHEHPTESFILKFDLLLNNPFVHSSIMLRSQVFDEVGLYSTDKSRQPPEDYELWSRIARKFDVANIPEILHIYREVPGSMSRKEINPFLDNIISISAENLFSILDGVISSEDALTIAALFHGSDRKISAIPPWNKIENFLYEAADKISYSTNMSCNILRERASGYLPALKSRYLIHKYGKVFSKIIIFIDRILRR